jgi:hypothetical protein
MRHRRPAVVRSLHDRTPDTGLAGDTTPEARLALVETLTREAWALAGRELPRYPRDAAPVCLRPLAGSR